MLVTIDGPGGAGKSTLARLLADTMSWDHVDSGALYRAAALLVEESADHDVGASDISAIIQGGEIHLNRGRVYLGKRDVTNMIRTSRIDEAVSKLATISTFRDVLTKIIREHVLSFENAVVDGRDIGTVVFPNADLKVYLYATLATRAGRRRAERPGLNLREVIQELRRRDQRDAQRSNSPMRVPPNALVVDTTNLTPAEVLNRVISNLDQIPKGAEL